MEPRLYIGPTLTNKLATIYRSKYSPNRLTLPSARFAACVYHLRRSLYKSTIIDQENNEPKNHDRQISAPEIFHVKQRQLALARPPLPHTGDSLALKHSSRAQKKAIYDITERRACGRFACRTAFCGAASTEMDLPLYAADLDGQRAIRQQRKKRTWRRDQPLRLQTRLSALMLPFIRSVYMESTYNDH